MSASLQKNQTSGEGIVCERVSVQRHIVFRIYKTPGTIAHTIAFHETILSAPRVSGYHKQLLAPARTSRQILPEAELGYGLVISRAAAPNCYQ